MMKSVLSWSCKYSEHAVLINLPLNRMNGGDLFDRITSKGVLTEQDARTAMRQILHAVDFLHDKSLVHRDLKPENLLYSSHDGDACVKLSDFGLSKFSNEKDNEGLETPCGTIAYTAPEITQSKVYRKGVDIWSCGCILYFMLFGRPPFYSDSEEEIYDLVSEGIWSFPESKVSEQAKDLVKRLLEKDPNKRLTVKQALAHPFFTQKDTQPNISRTTSQISPDTTAPTIPVPAIVFSLSPVGPPPTSSLSLAKSQPTPPISPSPSSPSTAAHTPPLAIPHLRASMHSAIDAQRGPLTPPLISPLESNIWKKRAKSRALLNNTSTDLSLDLSSTSPTHEDKNGFNDIKKAENELKFDDMMDMDMGLTY
eukprot:Phypoly_transcript_07107.p1 GENE.Phypoly_transcript_07107~~Phypoly_transcript_07107.p1  ORF type:complete len:367 (+),score=62.57 Phypoly_transcript_07107:373-1473(+)